MEAEEIAIRGHAGEESQGMVVDKAGARDRAGLVKKAVIDKYLVRRAKPFFLLGRTMEESREICEYSKRSLPDLLILRHEFFRKYAKF